MSSIRKVSPLLDHFSVGDAISEHDGVRCYPAVHDDTGEQYILKVISIPASHLQMDAFLLSGVYPSRQAALAYFKDLATGVVHEAQALRHLSRLEGFLSYSDWQIVESDDASGYLVYLLGTYKRSLEAHLAGNPMTQLAAVNLGLDLCAALTAGRNAGCLCVDLRPGNVFITEDGRYRIGDLGFIPLSCLDYASLPDRYRSRYTAPENQDPIAPISPTSDVYALGLILYQVYNNGVLPEQLTGAAPEYADYEMAEIILKACAADPAQRWRDPKQMGQALVSYMQCNSINDTPIISVLVPSVEPESDTPEQPEEVQAPEQETGEEAAVPETSQEGAEELAFLDSLTSDETAPSEENLESLSQVEVSDATVEMLEKLDELVSHEAPAPVVVPEPIDVPMPDPIPTPTLSVEAEQPEEESLLREEEPSAPELTGADPQPDEELEDEPENEAADADEEASDDSDILGYAPEKPRSHWQGFVVSILVLVAVCLGIFYFYQNYYLQSVDSLEVNVTQTTVFFSLKTDIPEDKLIVTCTDSYGNTRTASVSGGVAQISDLAPNTHYVVTITTNGFHKTVGAVKASFTTLSSTSILNFSAATGSESSTAVISFSVEGTDCESWTLTARAEGEEVRTVTFSGHLVTLTNLTVGKPYTLTLAPVADTLVTGDTEIVFVPSEIIYAQNVKASYSDEGIRVRWEIPDGVNVESWTVHCFNNSGYDRTEKVTDSTVLFSEVNPDDTFMIEVTAAGMTQSIRVSVNTVKASLTDLSAQATSDGKINLTWNSVNEPADGWIVWYQTGTLAGSSLPCSGNSAVLSPVLPGAEYKISILNGTTGSAEGDTVSCLVPAAPAEFALNGLTADDVIIFMFPTPEKEIWDYTDVSSGSYTTTFASGEDASLLFQSYVTIADSKDPVDVLFALYRGEELVGLEGGHYTWNEMWTDGYFPARIGAMPRESGGYHMDIFFNGQLLNTIFFSVA